MTGIAAHAKKLELKVGDLVEIDGRSCDVAPDGQGGVTLEPAITKTVARLREERGARGLTSVEFNELFGHLPVDDEG